MQVDLLANPSQIQSGDDRYIRDLRRYRLARRMIEREVRTSIISKWTGLTHTRIRSLWKTCARRSPNKTIRRRRGKPPFDVGFFWHSPQAQMESAVVTGLCMATGLIPTEPVQDLRTFPTVTRGELLCTIFDLYCALSENPARPFLSMEHVVLLAAALAQRKELMSDVCELCQGFVVRDRLSVANKPCIYCTTRTSMDKKAHQTHESFLQNDLFGKAAARPSFQTDPFGWGISSEQETRK